MLTLKKVYNRKPLGFTRIKYSSFSRRVLNISNNDLSVITMRTNVLGDFIERFNNDIAVVESNNEYSDEYECKYVAFFRLGLIIVVMIFMFIDWDGKSGGNGVNEINEIN